MNLTYLRRSFEINRAWGLLNKSRINNQKFRKKLTFQDRTIQGQVKELDI